jgi:membrane-bound lytic murein transglycosylase F
MRGIYRFQVVSLVVLSLTCGKNTVSNITVINADSLAAQVERTIEEKKHILAMKRELESSQYSRAILSYRPIIRKYAKRHGFDWRLIAAQIMQESKFHEAARSPVGASGLMQLMPETARTLTRELDAEHILLNPRDNIAAGIYHLKKQYDYFPEADAVNRTQLSLASYNCGAGRIFDAQNIARYYQVSPYLWSTIREYLTLLKSTDWQLHLQIWPLGRPKHGYFYGYKETISYVDSVWDLYQIFVKIL